jgi:hypothetical protein
MRIAPILASATLALGLAATSTIMMPSPAHAQIRGQNAEIGGALTERQARARCRSELRGSRESRRALAVKMRNCVIEKTVGGR